MISLIYLDNSKQMNLLQHKKLKKRQSKKNHHKRKKRKLLLNQLSYLMLKFISNNKIYKNLLIKYTLKLTSMGKLL